MSEALAIFPAAAAFFLVMFAGCVLCGLIERRQEIQEDRKRRANLFQSGGLLK